jgi:hypothetical protein
MTLVFIRLLAGQRWAVPARLAQADLLGDESGRDDDPKLIQYRTKMDSLAKTTGSRRSETRKQ